MKKTHQSITEATRKSADQDLQEALKFSLDNELDPASLLQKMEVYRVQFGAEPQEDRALTHVKRVIEGLEQDIAHVQADIKTSRTQLEANGLQIAEELAQAQEALAAFHRKHPESSRKDWDSATAFECFTLEGAVSLGQLRQEQHVHMAQLTEDRIATQQTWLEKTEAKVSALQQVCAQYQASSPADGPKGSVGLPASSGFAEKRHAPTHEHAPTAAS